MRRKIKIYRINQLVSVNIEDFKKSYWRSGSIDKSQAILKFSNDEVYTHSFEDFESANKWVDDMLKTELLVVNG